MQVPDHRPNLRCYELVLQLAFPWRIIVLKFRVENLQPGRLHQNLLAASLKTTFVLELRILVSLTFFTP